MASERELLPLFPLNLVLFPHSRTQLHIFEPKYRLMIDNCLEKSSPFGIALIRSENENDHRTEPYLVGTKVRILNVHRYEDGRYDLTVEGVERFRIREFDDQAPYLRGKIENLVELEEDDQNHLSELCIEARGLAETLLKEHVDNQDFAIKVLFPNDPEQLSFAIANMLDFSPIRKQFFLELVETSVRLEYLIEVLKELSENIISPLRKLTAVDLRDWVTPN
jgi:Lon protease-like protein